PKAYLPIEQRVGPAGSCTGGFRTQGARNPSQNAPIADNAFDDSLSRNLSFHQRETASFKRLPPSKSSAAKIAGREFSPFSVS
ncbi:MULTISPECIES: hypothetical protein, partial [unclassified Sphingobium]|uniref:hypothetical protein n=1 Tax=unclassified Sphingobium TaxID=2611147 RepID=UPI001C966F51